MREATGKRITVHSFNNTLSEMLSLQEDLSKVQWNNEPRAISGQVTHLPVMVSS